MDKVFHSERKQYIKGVLLEDQVDENPIVQFENWLADARKAECQEPTAMTLSTCGSDMRVSSRVVLMKGVDFGGITFFTNYDSRKGLQLLENPHGSLLFYWSSMERQIRIEGKVSKVTEEESDNYFDSRPEASRVSSIISPQSSVIPDRNWLEKRWQDASVSGQNGVGRPSHWGGYRLMPDYFEFWQGRENRLHDRVAYQRNEMNWRICRLGP